MFTKEIVAVSESQRFEELDFFMQFANDVDGKVHQPVRPFGRK